MYLRIGFIAPWRNVHRVREWFFSHWFRPTGYVMVLGFLLHWTFSEKRLREQGFEMDIVVEL